MGERSNETRARVIYAQTFKIRGVDGVIRDGEIKYTISLHIHAYESGDVSWHGDDRSCHFDPSDRALTRDILITSPDAKSTINIGHMMTAVASPGGKYFGNSPCNSHMPSDYEAYVDQSLGSRQDWQMYIEGDKDSVDALLALIGSVQTMNPPH